MDKEYKNLVDKHLYYFFLFKSLLIDNKIILNQYIL